MTVGLRECSKRNCVYEYSEKASGDSIVLGGNLGRDGLDYAMMCRAASPDGRIEVIGESITVYDATEVFLYWSELTTYRMHVDCADGQDEGLVKKDALRDALARKLDKAAATDYGELTKRQDRKSVV